jgi:hypothetical protein
MSSPFIKRARRIDITARSKSATLQLGKASPQYSCFMFKSGDIGQRLTSINHLNPVNTSMNKPRQALKIESLRVAFPAACGVTGGG